MREASFAYHLGDLRDDFRYYERGREYELPSLIPKEHQNLNDPKTLLMDPSATRYADYSRKSTEIYAFNEEERAYGYGGSVLPQYGKRLLNRLREKLSELISELSEPLKIKRKIIGTEFQVIATIYFKR